jgi:hypothetical protein
MLRSATQHYRFPKPLPAHKKRTPIPLLIPQHTLVHTLRTRTSRYVVAGGERDSNTLRRRRIGAPTRIVRLPLSVLAHVDAVVAVVECRQALLFAFGAFGRRGHAGAVGAGCVGVVAAYDPSPAEVVALEDFVAVAVEGTAGCCAVVGGGAGWEDTVSHGGGEGGCE